MALDCMHGTYLSPSSYTDGVHPGRAPSLQLHLPEAQQLPPAESAQTCVPLQTFPQDVLTGRLSTRARAYGA